LTRAILFSFLSRQDILWRCGAMQAGETSTVNPNLKANGCTTQEKKVRVSDEVF
jgi:hypothetical protein